MYYRINVSKLNKKIGSPFYEHYFATSEDSVTDKAKAIELLKDFKKMFPIPMYKISMTKWDKVGEPFNLDELIADPSKKLSKSQLKQLTDSTKRMLTKYSVELCLNAVTLNNEGFGASGVADTLIGKWNAYTGNALINAGNDILSVMK